MSFQLNVPPSVVAKTAQLEKQLDAEAAADGEPKRQSREDWKKLKELEEARKAGTAPAMKDEEGKDINPHIPQYIMQAPWYFGANQATLRHQRVQEELKKEYTKMNEWYSRGIKVGTAATKYRKGACENCGAMTHKKKDCLERPRKVGAKFSGEDFAPDEHLQPVLDFDYEGKRDLWNGYDTENHKKIIENYAKLEEAKRQLKSDRLDTSIQDDKNKDEEEAAEEEDNEDEDEDKYADDVDMPGQKFETKQRITVRNLRIREDTAKYLHNLDVNSAHYDPKTRSMRDNPFEKTGKTSDQLPYAGDNFVRYSGDAQKMGERQVFAWEAYEKGTDINVQADPTRLELLEKEYKKRKEDYKTDQKGGILAKYGGEEHLDAPSKQLLLAQTEDYVEYSRHGTVLKGQEKAKIKSIYEEDIYLNNHTSVWGSYWRDGRWGFICCHSLIKESYCTGDAGKTAQENSIPDEGEIEEELPEQTLVQQHIQKRIEKQKKKKRKNKKNKKKKKKKYSSSSESSSSEEEEEDPEEARERRIREAMKKLEERDKQAEEIMKIDERKRPYNVMYDNQAPDEDMMEAYRRKRQREEDPMSQFFTK